MRHACCPFHRPDYTRLPPCIKPRRAPRYLCAIVSAISHPARRSHAMRIRHVFALAVAALAAFSLPCAADIWYVNVANQAGPQDGKSWSTAFATIQPAIDAAHATGGGEVWIAKGEYGEPRKHVDTDINTGALVLKPGIALYGGFVGSESVRDARDPAKYTTTITGKASRDGQAAYHVVFGANGASLDGFTIRDGLANAEHPYHKYGAGIVCTSLDMSITNCVIENCGADNGGGGIYARLSSLTLTGCVVRNNRSDFGGNDPEEIGCGAGIWFGNSERGLRIESCMIENNRASGRGGGLYVRRARVTVVNSKFDSNSALWGGGFAAYSDCNASVAGTTFTDNRGRFGGAVRIAHRSPSDFSRCSFRSNTSTGGAGGALNFYYSGSANLSDCSLVDNKAEGFVGGGVRLQSAAMHAVRSEFRNNSGTAGGMACLTDSSLILEACTVTGNSPYALMATTTKEVVTAINSKFGTNGNALYHVEPTRQNFASVEQMAAAFPTWRGNRSIAPGASPPPNRVAAVTPAPIPPPAPTPMPISQDTLAIKTEGTSFTISGVFAFCSVIAIVFLVGVFAVVLGGRGNTSRQTSASIVLPDEPETTRPRFR